MRDALNEHCNVSIRAICKSTGAILHERVGHNIWTSVGREYSALLKTYRGRVGANLVPYRTDKIAYVGVGTGTQPETVDVINLVSPIAFSGTTWLKEINHNKTSFPNSGSRMAIRYVVEFGEDDFDGNIYISECGLFTDGHSIDFTPGNRSTSVVDASIQAPLAYHTFAPIPKTPNVSIELVWELRH
jgi:hypothetical protein